jgi:hypothetical protein
MECFCKYSLSVIFPVVLYGYEAWSLTMRKEYRLGKIFGPRRDMVTRKWRRLHNEELYVLLTKYPSGDRIKKNEMGEAYGTYR